VLRSILGGWKRKVLLPKQMLNLDLGGPKDRQAVTEIDSHPHLPRELPLQRPLFLQ